jgi:hypothetical protein
MLDSWLRNRSIIYSDYLAKSYVDAGEAEKQKQAGRLLNYDSQDRIGFQQARTF